MQNILKRGGKKEGMASVLGVGPQEEAGALGSNKQNRHSGGKKRKRERTRGLQKFKRGGQIKAHLQTRTKPAKQEVVDSKPKLRNRISTKNQRKNKASEKKKNLSKTKRSYDLQTQTKRRKRERLR